MERCRKQPTTTCFACNLCPLCKDHSALLCPGCNQLQPRQQEEQQATDTSSADKQMSLDCGITCYMPVDVTALYLLLQALPAPPPMPFRVDVPLPTIKPNDCPVREWVHEAEYLPSPSNKDLTLFACQPGTIAAGRRRFGGISAWVAAGDGRGIIGRMQEVWSQLMQEAANVPVTERVALRPQKKDTFDLTSARSFIENREYQRKVVELLKEFYPNLSIENRNLRVYTVVFSMLNSVVQLHTVWRQKTWPTDEEVSQAEQAAKRLGHCWNLMGWKPTLWVHWTVAHRTWFLRKYRTMYMFCSVPTERRNSPFKTFFTKLLQGLVRAQPAHEYKGDGSHP